MQAKHLTKETIKNIGINTTQNYPEFRPGDTICVTTKILEGEKERLQDFEGVVLGLKGSGASQTFRVRKISQGIAVERIFPYHSPSITKITVTRQGVVRRAKLYYIRDRQGKEAEVEKKITYKKNDSSAKVA